MILKKSFLQHTKARKEDFVLDKFYIIVPLFNRKICFVQQSVKKVMALTKSSSPLPPQKSSGLPLKRIGGRLKKRGKGLERGKHCS